MEHWRRAARSNEARTRISLHGTDRIVVMETILYYDRYIFQCSGTLCIEFVGFHSFALQRVLDALHK